MDVSFSKYHGAGNDFILLDDRSSFFPSENGELILRLCHRQLGIGADGLILLQRGTGAPYRMRIFNNDGKEAAMCGNGLRCLAAFIRNLGDASEIIEVESMGGTHRCALLGDGVSVSMGKPHIQDWGLTLSLVREKISVHLIHTGVPHAVIFVADLKAVDVQELGQKIRSHPYLHPEGANVNFCSLSENNELHVRTYERGVERETLACGTGVAAAAIAAQVLYQLQNPVTVIPATGQRMEVEIGTEILLKGPVVHVFSGKIDLS